jgi:hypothetical protein
MIVSYKIIYFPEKATACPGSSALIPDRDLLTDA